MGKNLLLNFVKDVPRVFHMDDCSSDGLISATHLPRSLYWADCRSASLFSWIYHCNTQIGVYDGSLKNAANERFLPELLMQILQYGKWLNCKPAGAKNVFLCERLQ